MQITYEVLGKEEVYSKSGSPDRRQKKIRREFLIGLISHLEKPNFYYDVTRRDMTSRLLIFHLTFSSKAWFP